MPANPERRLRPRMTLRQIGVLVVFAAIVSAILAPELRMSGETPRLLLVGLFEVPLALMTATAILVRRGPLKLWFFSFVCTIPILALMIALNAFVLAVVGTVRLRQFPWPHLVVGAICDLALLGCLAFLVRRLVPGVCPLCRRPAMLRDPSVPRFAHFSTRTEPRLCLACGARFRRAKGESWVDVDTLPDEPTAGPAGRLPRSSRRSPTLADPHPGG